MKNSMARRHGAEPGPDALTKDFAHEPGASGASLAPGKPLSQRFDTRSRPGLSTGDTKAATLRAESGKELSKELSL